MTVSTQALRAEVGEAFIGLLVNAVGTVKLQHGHHDRKKPPMRVANKAQEAAVATSTMRLAVMCQRGSN